MALKCKCTKRILPHYHAEAVLGHNMVRPFPVKEKQFNEWNETIANRHIVRRQKNSCDERAKKTWKITRICVHVWRRMLLQNQKSHILCAPLASMQLFLSHFLFFLVRPQKKKCKMLVGYRFAIIFNFTALRIPVKWFVRCCTSLLEQWHLHLSCSTQPSTDCRTLCIAPSTRQSLYEFRLHCLYVSLR